MPAPAITVTPPDGPFTYVVSSTDKNGFRIAVSSLSQPTSTGNWSVTIGCSQITSPAPSPPIPVEDRVNPVASHVVIVPFNEAPSLATITAKIQAYVDFIYDNLVPNP